MVGSPSKKVEQREAHRRQHEEFLKNREYCFLTSSQLAGRSRMRRTKLKRRADSELRHSSNGPTEQRCKQCSRACKCRDICIQIQELKSLTNEFTNAMESEKDAIATTVQKLSTILQSLPPQGSLHVYSRKDSRQLNKNSQVNNLLSSSWMQFSKPCFCSCSSKIGLTCHQISDSVIFVFSMTLYTKDLVSHCISPGKENGVEHTALKSSVSGPRLRARKPLSAGPARVTEKGTFERRPLAAEYH
jgi:hypothetical protein